MRHTAHTFFSTALILLCAALLAACGGGGTADVVVDKAGVALFTSAGAGITLDPGTKSTYTIGGGGGAKFTSYSAASSNAAIATATVSVP